MAIYHMSVTAVSKGKGQSAIAHSAYIDGKKLHDADGNAKKFGHADRVAYTEVLLPKNAPKEYESPEILWNAVEKAEKQVNARLARSITVALPRELSPDENIQLAKAIAKLFVDDGMCVELACHNLQDGNPHLHMLTPVRRIGKDGNFAAKAKKMYLLRNVTTGSEFYGDATMLKKANANLTDSKFEKVYKYKQGNEILKLTPSQAKEIANSGMEIERVSRSPVDTKVDLTKWNDKAVLRQWRKSIADEINRALIEKEKITGHEITKVTEKSYKDRGLTEQGYIPTIHEGYRVRQLKKDGIDTDKIAYNDAVKSHNDALAKEYSQLQGILQRLLIMIKERIKSLYDRIRKGTEYIEKTVESIRECSITSGSGIKTRASDSTAAGREQQAQRIESQIERREQEAERRKQQVDRVAGRQKRIEKYENLLALDTAILNADDNLRSARLEFYAAELPSYFVADPRSKIENDILAIGKKPLIGRKFWIEQSEMIAKKWSTIAKAYNLNLDIDKYDDFVAKKDVLIDLLEKSNNKLSNYLDHARDMLDKAKDEYQNAYDNYNNGFKRLATDDPELLGTGIRFGDDGEYDLKPASTVAKEIASGKIKDMTVLQDRIDVVLDKKKWFDTSEYKATHETKIKQNIDKSRSRYGRDEYER